MGRGYRNRQQDSILDTIFDLLKMAPVWVGPVKAVAVPLGCSITSSPCSSQSRLEKLTPAF